MSRKAMLIDLARCAGCGACVVACQMSNNTSPSVKWNALETCEWGNYPEAGRCYLPHACMQCDAPACVVACPTGASFKADDGVTLVDYELCIGCGTCVDACPYGARHINKDASYYFGQSEPAPYEAYGIERIDVAEKCVFCNNRVEAGELPACVVNCPGRARVFGDIEDPESDIAKKLDRATRIDETGFYYIQPPTIPSDMLTTTIANAAVIEKQKQ